MSESIGTVKIVIAFCLAIALLIMAIIATGCELVLHKSTPSPEIVTLSNNPEAIATPRVLYRVPDGDQVFTINSEMSRVDGKHAVGSVPAATVELYYAIPPTPAPTFAAPFGGNGFEFQ